MIKSIIISGPPAIGKTTIAKGLAKEFGLLHLSGGDILKELAEEEGFEIQEIQDKVKLNHSPIAPNTATATSSTFPS